jgi:F0F1-type ATP synthase assembly protein I
MNRITTRHDNSTEGKGQSNLISSVRTVSRIGSFGLMMGVSILMGYFLGSYIDRKLETYPWFMMLFVVLFMIGAFIKLFQDAGTLNGINRARKKIKGNATHTS